MDASAKSPMDDIKKLGEILMKRTSEKGIAKKQEQQKLTK